MAERKVEVVIGPDGTVKVEVDGVQGSSCQLHTGALIRALGGDVVEDVKKPEFYQTTRDSEKVKGGW